MSQEKIARLKAVADGLRRIQEFESAGYLDEYANLLFQEIRHQNGLEAFTRLLGWLRVNANAAKDDERKAFIEAHNAGKHIQRTVMPTDYRSHWICLCPTCNDKRDLEIDSEGKIPSWQSEQARVDPEHMFAEYKFMQDEIDLLREFHTHHFKEH